MSKTVSDRRKRMAERPSRIMVGVLIAASALGLCQCKRPDHTPYDFSLTLETTPDAASRLAASRNNIEITTWFYGQASPQYKSEADELNRIRLGYQTQDYSGAARNVRIVSYSLDPAGLSKTVDHKAYVVINVTSEPSDASGPVSPAQAQDYMIECESYVGPVDLLQTARHTLKCDKYRP